MICIALFIGQCIKKPRSDQSCFNILGRHKSKICRFCIYLYLVEPSTKVKPLLDMTKTSHKSNDTSSDVVINKIVPGHLIRERFVTHIY